MLSSLGLSAWQVVGGRCCWSWVVVPRSNVADWPVEQARSQMALLLSAAVVIHVHLFVAADALFEFAICFTPFSNGGFLSAKIVDIESLLVEWHVGSVVSLAFISKDVRVELLLPLPEGVDVSGSSVVHLLHTALRLPVRIGTESCVRVVAIIVDWGLVFIAAAKHARLELLVLYVSPVQLTLLVLSFHGR